MRKPSRIVGFLLGLGALGAGLVSVEALSAIATTNCVVSGVTNSNGKVTFEIRYSDNTTGCSWTVPAGVTSIETAVVGAGGAGGSVQQPGGGGGGAVLYNPNLTTTPGSAIPITIGQGVNNAYQVQSRGASGGSTSFGTVIALGGGGGGSGNQYQTGNWLGGGGGSTGGSNRHGRTRTASTQSNYDGWTTYANSGGVGSGSYNTGTPTAFNGDGSPIGGGGGGGGAGSPGLDSTTVQTGSTITVTGGDGGRGIFLLGKCLGAGAPGLSSHTSTASVTRSAATFNIYTGTNSVSGSHGANRDCIDPQGNIVSASASSGGPNQAAVANSGSATGADISNDGLNQKSSDGNVLISYTIPAPIISSSAITNVQRPVISGTGIDGHTITVTAGGATYTTSVSSGIWAVNTNTATPTSGALALTINGTNTVTASATDALGGVSSAATQTLTIDTVAPAAPSIVALPTLTNQNNRSISFTPEAGSSAQCALDAGEYTACSSPYSTGVLADGAHTFRTKTTDAAGNTSAVGQYTWTIDTVAPSAPNITTNAAYQTTSNVTVAFSANAGTTLTCRLDSGAYTACSSATTAIYNNLTEGAHTVTVYSADAAGNQNASSYSFTVDTIAPNTPVVPSSPALTDLSSRSITFTSDLSETTLCSLNEDPFTICTSPLVTGVLPEGLNRLRVKTVDLAGNSSAISTYNWSIDSIAPLAPTITSSMLITQGTSATLTFTGEVGAIATCSVNTGTWAPCVSGDVFNNFTDGAHSIRVKLTDAAGNESSASTYSWTRDSIAPMAPTRTANNSGPTGRTRNTSATFNFISELLATNQCRHLLEGAVVSDWASCSSGFTINNLASGAHQLQVRSTDAAGNLSSVLTYVWEIDTQGPSQPTVTFENNQISLSGGITGANGDSYEFKLVDSNDNILQHWGTVQGQTFALRVSNGDYQVFARLVDDLGNIGSAVSETVTVTGQPAPAAASTPRLTIAATNGYSTTSTLDASIDWPVGTKSVRLFSTQNNNGGAGLVTSLSYDWLSAGERKTKSWNFTPAGIPTVTATHNLTAEFLDAAGVVINTQLASVIIDVQAPTFSSAIPTAIDNNTLPIQINATDEAGGSGLGDVLITRTGGTIARASTPALEPYQVVNGYVTIPNVTLGETMTVQIRDRAGNISAASFQVAALNRQTLNPIAKFTGTAKVGQTLKLTPGTWPKTHKVTYQWLASGVPIAGATKTTFKLTAAQAGKRINVAVTGSRATYYPITVSTPTGAMVTGGTLSPGTPTITGTTTVGQTLTATSGNWANTPNLTFAWKRGTTTIATGLTYTLTNQDAGQKLTFTVAATKPGFTSLSKTITTATISGGNITEQAVNVSSAIVKGKKVFTANTPTWAPSGVTISYQWLKNGAPISKATAKTYTALTTDVGTNLSVRVTGTKIGFVTKIVTSLEVLVP